MVGSAVTQGMRFTGCTSELVQVVSRLEVALQASQRTSVTGQAQLGQQTSIIEIT